jgi:RNA polymerase sigma-70 factor (ECF subfamily)
VARVFDRATAGVREEVMAGAHVNGHTAALWSGVLEGQVSFRRATRDQPSVSTYNAESSVELLLRVRAGDEEALDVLLRRYVPALRRWASGRLPRWARDMTDTEDMVQDAVLKSLRRLGTFTPQREGALQAYLRQAVMNRVRDEIRRHGRTPDRDELDDETPGGGVSPLEAAISAEGIHRYEAALAQLKDEDREAIVARLEMGYSYGEVAVMTGKPSADAARVAVSRALVRLAELMRRGRS